ncbi:MAG: hypothetical protein IPI42_13240 [Saprospiraceae bacterium]|nr:hypothetical protein [Candidatus Parvibacillus calidus]
MNYKEFEKNIKNKLSEHEAQIDTNALVSAIFLKKKKGKRFPAWWGYVGALIVVTLVSTLWIFDSRNNDLSYKDRAATNPTAESEQPGLTYDDVYDRTPTDGLNTKDNSVKNEMVASIASGNNLDVNSGTASFQDNQSTYHKALSGEDIQQASAITVSDVDDSKIPVSNTLSEEKIVSSDGIQSTYSTSIARVKKGVSDIGVLTSKSVDLHLNNKALFDLGPGVKCPTFKSKRRIGFALIPEVGVFYPLANFKSEAGPENQPFAMRERNERSLEGLQAGLYGKIFLSNSPWYLKTGLNYGRITRQMTFNDSYIQRDTTIGIIAITESQNHDTLTIIKGPIVTETTISKYEKRHYFHHMMSLPIVLGAQYNLNGIILGVEAGVNLNLISEQTGYVMVSPNQFGLVKDANLYRKRTGLSYLAGVQVGVPLFDKNILALAIRANINPNNFALDNVPFNEKYQMLGVHLMYEIRF